MSKRINGHKQGCLHSHHPHRPQTALCSALCCLRSHMWTFPNMAFRSIQEQDHCFNIMVSAKQSDFPKGNQFISGRKRNDFTQMIHVIFFSHCPKTFQIDHFLFCNEILGIIQVGMMTEVVKMDFGCGLENFRFSEEIF